MMRVIGIDSGLDGAIVALEVDGDGPPRVVLATRAPTVATKTRRVYRPTGMVELLRGLGPVHFAALERGGVRPGEGPSGAWSVGFGFGLWEMALAALGIPYETPTPQAWQRDVYRGVAGDGKERSVIACDRLLPTLDLFPGRCRKAHTGIADAGCLALYAARRAGAARAAA